MTKEEYKKKIKKLLKKYHPDLCNDESLEKINNDITIKLNVLLEQINKDKPEDVNNKAYELYKLGISYYKNIHHDKFYNKSKNKTNTPKTFEEQFTILNKIFFSFNIAEYYFDKVISDYPNSEWTSDSKEKIIYLKKLYKSYENMDIENNNQIIDNNKFVYEMGLNIL